MEHFCGTEMICVQDFCGNGVIQGSYKYQINFWADWCPSCKGISFGGYWNAIPNLPYASEPDFDNCPIIKAHIAQYEPLCEFGYQEWLRSVE